MRTDNSIKNSISSLVGNMISYLVAFVAQAIFIRILGAEYLGLNGLFTNVLSMLSIFELGIGSAIVYNMYKPIAENDIEKIKSLMIFYKKAYTLIMIIIGTLGLIVLPFLKYIVGEITVDVNIYYVYLLFLSSTVMSYFMAYKRNLIIANQRNYIINIIHMLYLISLNVAQLLIIYLTKNYYVYLFLKVICQLFENLIINYIANKEYGFIKGNDGKKLDKTTEKDIFSRVKALFFHKIGLIIVLGTDNIIISKFFGIITVGLYNNYSTIINGITTLFSQVITSTTASVGNLIVSKDNKKKYNVFKKLRFINFWISTLTATCLLVIVQPFVSVWAGKEYLLATNVVIMLTFNYFQMMQRQTYFTFKDSAGIWIEDKYVPLVEAILNIVFSIICLKIFGLVGVFMGTFISSLTYWCYSYPKFIYKKLFNRSYTQYIKETTGYVALFIVIAAITYEISTLIILNNLILQILVSAVISLIIPNTIMFLIFRKSENFEYFAELLKKILKKLYGKISKKDYEC